MFSVQYHNIVMWLTVQPYVLLTLVPFLTLTNLSHCPLFQALLTGLRQIHLVVHTNQTTICPCEMLVSNYHTHSMHDLANIHFAHLIAKSTCVRKAQIPRLISGVHQYSWQSYFNLFCVGTLSAVFNSQSSNTSWIQL